MATVKDIDLFKISQVKATDFSSYDAIGFASGVYYHKLHKGIEKLASEIDLAGKKVFTVYTCGISLRIKKYEQKKFGFFEKIGGIAKGHPNEKDFKKAREFIKNI